MAVAKAASPCGINHCITVLTVSVFVTEKRELLRVNFSLYLPCFKPCSHSRCPFETSSSLNMPRSEPGKPDRKIQRGKVVMSEKSCSNYLYP